MQIQNSNPSYNSIIYVLVAMGASLVVSRIVALPIFRLNGKALPPGERTELPEDVERETLNSLSLLLSGYVYMIVFAITNKPVLAVVIATFSTTAVAAFGLCWRLSVLSFQRLKRRRD